jgi:hypothetical protein
MDRLPSNLRSMVENRKQAGVLATATSAMSSMSLAPPSLKDERDAIIDDKPKYPILKAYFDNIVARACAEEDEFDD